jgi:hypothetical protein
MAKQHTYHMLFNITPSGFDLIALILYNNISPSGLGGYHSSLKAYNCGIV